MKTKTRIQLLVLSVVISLSQVAMSAVPHNSKRFVISNYFYPDINGDYTRYRAHGFAQQHTSQNKGRLFFMPIIHRENDDIEFINEVGMAFDPLKNTGELARSIIIPIHILAKLPTKSQVPAISSALSSGVEINSYVREMHRNPDGSFFVIPPAQVIAAQLKESTKPYQELLDKQKEIIDLYSNYQSELVSLSELEISVILGNQVIANQRFDGTYIANAGELTNIEVVYPTLYQQNRIATGKLNVMVRYKFRDANTKTIDARFDAKKIIDRFLEETQKSMTSSSSSGWQVLGFGSRRKKISSTFNSTVKNTYKGSEYDSTSVEMFDASDDMIKEFERDFFPEISKQKVIDNHLAAAELAGNSGNQALRDLHLKYASSLSNSDPNLEVDIAGAVASLSAGDYAGFIAKGVRWGSHKGIGNSSFRRVVHNTAEIEAKIKWSQMRTVSVQHALTETVGILKPDRHKPNMGLCGAFQYNYPVTRQNIHGQLYTEQKQGIMPSCIVEGGAAHQAGLQPGMIITEIEDEVITTERELNELLEDYEPADTIEVTIIEYQGWQSQKRNISLRLTAGRPNV